MPSEAGQIDLVLSDDWELRGDGSGNMRAIQFATLVRLLDVYERHGLRASINAEVLQQFAHLEHGERHPEVAALAREWEAQIVDAVRRGHDVQLHLHPQWTKAEYSDGRWELNGSWSMLDYPDDQVATLIERGRAYLESLLQPADPEYRCVSFRSGSWCVAPHAGLLHALAANGIVLDASVVDGLYYNTARVTVDFRGLSEPFLPYYPAMGDARVVSHDPQPLIEVPTHSFAWRGEAGPKRPAADWRYRLSRAPVFAAGRFAPGSLAHRFLPPNGLPVPDGGYRGSYAADEWTNVDGQTSSPGIRVSDISLLTYAAMKEVVRNARRRARASGWERVPVVVQNHTKDIGNWDPIERFARFLARQGDVEVITLRTLAERLTAGAYPVRPAVRAT